MLVLECKETFVLIIWCVTWYWHGNFRTKTLTDPTAATFISAFQSAISTALPVQLLAVSVKLLTFWHSNPDAWFAVAKVHFALHGILLEEICYFYVIATLDSSTPICVSLLCLPSLHRTTVLSSRSFFFRCMVWHLTSTPVISCRSRTMEKGSPSRSWTIC